MARKIRRSQVIEWLEAHGGQKGDIRYETVDSPNPAYDPSQPPKTGAPTPKIRETHVTWTANDGQILTVIEREGAGTSPEGGTGPIEDVEYEVVDQGPPEKKETTDSRSPELRRKQEEDHREAIWNQTDPRGSGRYETHDERLAREQREAADRRAEQANERQIAAQERQAAQDEARNAIERERVDIERGRAGVAARAEDRQGATAERQTAVAEGQLAIAQEEAARKGRTPTVLGTPTDEQERIAYIDPATGEIKSQANPLYDQLKTESARKREELKLAVETNKMKLEEATAEYNRWFDENVRTPLLLAAERRSQATEKRQALQAEEQRRQFKAQNEIARANVGQAAAETASANERAMLPYRAGPAFGEQFSSAINSLAAGGRMDTNAAAGINFTADAFEFDAPNFKKIARSAARDALKHLTPYDPLAETFAVPDYGGINMPTAGTLSTAPAMPALLDTTELQRGALPNYRPPTPQIQYGGY